MDSDPLVRPTASPQAQIRALVAAAERQTQRSVGEPGSSGFGRVLPLDVSPVAGMEGLLARELPGYRILGEIHRGGQGVVFRAVQLSTRREVALKVLREGPFAGASERARFEREVQILAQLRHSDIVAIHDSGQAAGHFYLVTDFIEGRPLDVHVAASGRDVRQTVRLFARVCEAVNAAHLRGVIHRDLKPGNILVDKDGAPRVLDFGLAKIDELPPQPQAGDSPTPPSSAASTIGDFTQTGQFVGSLPWCSPEQAAGAEIDIRTDVYSLGVVLYQLLTARFPYQVTGAADEILSGVRTQEPLRPRTARRDLDDELETILLKCLQKEPARRYQSAGELARDLRRYLVGEPIEAKRDSAAYVLRKALRRHWVGSSIAAACLVLGAVALAVFVALWQSAGRERDRALAAEADQREARELAEREGEKSRAVTRFLREMLGSADPRATLGREVHIRDVLENAQRELDAGSLADQPDAEAAVRATLGRTYLSISRNVEAAVQLEAALDAMQRLFGPQHPDLIDPLSDLARVRRGQGRLEESEALARRALALAEATYGPDSVELAPQLATLSFTILERGDLREPETLLRRRLTLMAAALGAAHPDVAIATADLAQCAHDTAESEQLLNQAVAIAQGTLAANHPSFVRMFRARAHAQFMRRAYADSESSFQEALRRARIVFGQESSEVYGLLADLAMLHEYTDRRQERLATLEESIRVARAVFGPDNLEIVRRMLDMCLCLNRMGCAEDAEQVATDALSMHKRIGEPDPRLGAVLRHTLASLALQRQDWDGAEVLAYEILDVPREALAPFTWPHEAALGVLGAVHTARGEYPSAEALLLEACERIGDTGFVRAHRQVQIERLVRLYEAWQKPDEAERWRQELIVVGP